MKINLLLGLTITGAALLFSNNTNAQCKGWNWPADKATAEEKNVLYGDYVKSGNYEMAIEPHQWLVENAPNLNTSLYINGTKIYENLAKKEKDPVKKKAYVKKAMELYDLRVKNCGDEINVINRKAMSAYVFWVNDKEKRADLLALFEKVFEKSGDNVANGVCRAYANVIKVNKTSLTEEQILDKFDDLFNVIEKNMDKGKDVESWQKAQDLANGVLPTIINIDCDFVRKNFGPKFKEDPSDLKMAKRIFKYMLTSKCTDDPLWTKAAKVLQTNEPSDKLALILGKKCLAEGDYACADQYFAEAIKLTKTNQGKSDIYIQQGLSNMKRGRKSTARDYFKKALALSPSNREAYTYIGNLYFTSYNDCAGKQDKVKDRLVFIAAYNMFSKAGNSKLMQSAKNQFPSKEEVFERNYKKGQSMNVGCWIGEAVILDTRD